MTQKFRHVCSRAKRCLAERKRLARRRKLLLHGLVLVAIGICLGVEGAKRADWLFLGFSILVEAA